MNKLIVPTTVWVPFEMQPNGSEKKCDDLPRFATIQEVRHYLSLHSDSGLRKRKLRWEERTEKEFIDEYVAGIGTLKVLI